MNKRFFAYIGLIISSGAFAQTADEKMEDYSKALYEKHISESKFCDAILVAKKRFDYVSDNRTSDSKILAKKREWDNLANKIELDCRKEKWPEKEKNYKESLKKARANVELSEKINAQIKIATPKKDSTDRSCIRELKIINNSDHPIQAFEGSIFVKKYSIKDLTIKWEAQKARRPMPMQPEEFTRATPPINPKETRELNVCQFFFNGINNTLEGEAIINNDKLPGSTDDDSQISNPPLTSTEEMQGKYMTLRLKSVRIGSESNITVFDVSKKHISSLKKFILETELALKKENPFN